MGKLTQGLNRLRDLVHDDTTEGIGGTDGTAFTASQTALVTPVAASEQTLTKTKGSQSNQFRWRLDQSTATGSTYREFAKRNAANTDLDRFVFPGVAHTTNDELIIISSEFYRQAN